MHVAVIFRYNVLGDLDPPLKGKWIQCRFINRDDTVIVCQNRNV